MLSALLQSITRFTTVMHGSSSKRARAWGRMCPVVCVMSGDFVQRGSPAVYSKFARAEAAARCGADLVLELPLPWALSSAEGFARGAVGLLGGLGVVTHLSFGSECGELEPLQRVAEALLDPLLGEDLRAELQAGIPVCGGTAAGSRAARGRAGGAAAGAEQYSCRGVSQGDL